MRGMSQVVLLAVDPAQAEHIRQYVAKNFGYVPNVIPVGSQPSVATVDNRVDLTNQRVSQTECRIGKLERQVEEFLCAYERTSELVNAIRNA